MEKTYRFIKRDCNRLNEWRQFKKAFKAYDGYKDIRDGRVTNEAILNKMTMSVQAVLLDRITGKVDKLN